MARDAPVETPAAGELHPITSDCDQSTRIYRRHPDDTSLFTASTESVPNKEDEGYQLGHVALTLYWRGVLAGLRIVAKSGPHNRRERSDSGSRRYCVGTETNTWLSDEELIETYCHSVPRSLAQSLALTHLTRMAAEPMENSR
jgi:hypothetical protein